MYVYTDVHIYVSMLIVLYIIICFYQFLASAYCFLLWEFIFVFKKKKFWFLI